MINKLKRELKKLANKEKAKILSNFFKTGKGEYGEGDKFLGLTMPQLRSIAKDYYGISLLDIKKLLDSEIHEHRSIATIILTEQYSDNKEKVYKFYIKNAKRFNNWDLVDLSCHKIVGEYLFDKKRDVLYKLAKSKNLWERRISIVSTYYFIKNNDFKDTIKISETLMKDKHDLIHKATGWMLREMGKKNEKNLRKFLNKYCKVMPRTMLRYAIEKLPDRRRYM